MPKPPPLPPPRRPRPLPPPRFPDSEARTGRTNRDLSVFQAMASVFDEASPSLRLELVELVRGYLALSPAKRRAVLMMLTG